MNSKKLVKNKTVNGIGAIGIMKISEMLKTNSTLIDLNLSCTLIRNQWWLIKNDS